jgi:hypothetical protein
VWERAFATNADKARALVEEIERIGAEPFHAPDPLPRISEDEVHLITWMALEPEVHEVSSPRKPGSGTLHDKPGDDLAPGTLNSVLKQAG